MTLTGYVGHNIELKQTNGGVSTVSFRVGSTPRIRTQDGWTDGVTTWMTIVCYRALAEHVARCVYKGDPVIVHGKVRTQSWADSTGAQHERMVIEAGAVGHDLSRGVSAFARPAVHVDQPSMPAEVAPDRRELVDDDGVITTSFVPDEDGAMADEELVLAA